MAHEAVAVDDPKPSIVSPDGIVALQTTGVPVKPVTINV